MEADGLAVTVGDDPGEWSRLKGCAMMRTLGVPRENVNVVQEQPLPWRAPQVYVSFDGGPARTCRVTRHPGDLVRVEVADLVVPAGAQAEIQWTQDGRGTYAAGTVVPPPSASAPGVYIRVDESVSGIERRLGVRVAVHLPVAVTVTSGQILTGRTDDLSVGGAHLRLDPAEQTAFRRCTTEVARGADVVAELALPTGPARLRCLVTGVGDLPGDTRLRFVDVDGDTAQRLDAFLRDLQLNVAPR
uniref:PilZ domain-containing protein n=1 Tax=Paractinoplanes polyasparticus TaxID=2856853 RepID=UPI001C849950|nr:PilZ domain-containing protein [Actinoplanes polyasparticus]